MDYYYTWKTTDRYVQQKRLKESYSANILKTAFCFSKSISKYYYFFFLEGQETFLFILNLEILRISTADLPVRSVCHKAKSLTLVAWSASQWPTSSLTPHLTSTLTSSVTPFYSSCRPPMMIWCMKRWNWSGRWAWNQAEAGLCTRLFQKWWVEKF